MATRALRVVWRKKGRGSRFNFSASREPHGRGGTLGGGGGGGGGCPSLPDSQESKRGLRNGVHGTAYNGHREGGGKERKRKRLSAEGL